MSHQNQHQVKISTLVLSQYDYNYVSYEYYYLSWMLQVSLVLQAPTHLFLCQTYTLTVIR